jgi:hypothetical protein
MMQGNMGNILFLLLGTIFVLSSAILFVLQNKRRDIIFERLHLKRRRDSGFRTPPQSLTRETKRAQSISTPDYLDTFPPSKRSTLAEMKLLCRLENSAEVFADAPSDWTKHILPVQTSYRDAEDEMHTPCELSVGQIKNLGDFPDYATLSGVPLPKPYHEFDIKKALPRPYRPFRWSYHQTLCMSIDFCYPNCTDCSRSTY